MDTYADDLKHFTRASISTMLLKAQSSLDIRVENTDFLGMGFSAPKCKAMCFGMAEPDTQLHTKGVPVQWVDHHLVLGIYTDRGLTFRSQWLYVTTDIHLHSQSITGLLCSLPHHGQRNSNR